MGEACHAQDSLWVEQIAAVLKQAEPGLALPKLLRNWGSQSRRFIAGRSYSGLQPGRARDLEQLQDEHAQLKKLVAKLSLDKAILQDVATKNGHGPR